MTFPCEIRTASLDDIRRLSAPGTQLWLDTCAVAGISDAIARYVLEAFAIGKIRSLVEDPNAVVLVAGREANLAGYVVLRFGSCHGDIFAEIETLYRDSGALVGLESGRM